MPLPSRPTRDKLTPCGRVVTRTVLQPLSRSSIAARCHLSSVYTDVNAGRLHTPAEVGQDPAYALRSVTKLYRTTPLRGLWLPPQLKGPYFHDGNAATLAQAVDHYVKLFNLSLTAQQKADLVEYLKTL